MTSRSASSSKRKHSPKGRIVGVVLAAVSTAGIGGWFTMQSSAPWARVARLKIGSFVAPLVTPAVPKGTQVAGIELAFTDTTNATVGADGSSQAVELKVGRKSYEATVTPHNISVDGLAPGVNYEVTTAKEKGVDGLSRFMITAPLSGSQVDELILAELGRMFEINDGLEVRPIVVSQSGSIIGLRYMAELPTPGRLTNSHARIKLLCRAKEQTQAELDALQGADKSKVAVRPNPSWSLFSATLGEAVNSPEFQFLVSAGEQLAFGSELSTEDSRKLIRLLGTVGFAKYSAIRQILGDEASEPTTPPSFSFDHASGTIRPSTSVCDPGGILPKKDLWFKGIVKFLGEMPDYQEAVLAAEADLRGKFAQQVKEITAKVKEIAVIADATPAKIRLDHSGNAEFVWNGSRKIAETAKLASLAMPITASSQEVVARASMGHPIDASSSFELKELSGEQTISTDIVVSKGQRLIVKAGTKLALAPDVSIVVSGGELELVGTKAAPIIIKSTEQRPWGAVIVSQGGKATMTYANLQGGSESYRDFVRYDGMLSVHNSKVVVSDSSFVDGIVSLIDSKAELERVEFVNVLPKPFLSERAAVLARSIEHRRLVPAHQKVLAEVATAGEPHHEREFKYALDVKWNSAQLKQSAEELQEQFAKVLAEPGKWKAPQYAKGNYWADTKVSEGAYLDVYLDTPENEAFKNDVSYRYRNRFEDRGAHDAYLQQPWVPANWPFRLEYQGKIGRGHSEPGFHEVFEARFEFRKQTPPFSEQHLAPWSPWDMEVYLPFMQSGTFNNIPTVSGKAVYEYLSKQTGKSSFAFAPKVVVVTERLRQHLNLPTEWGSGPNPEQCNIITLDRTEIYDANDYLDYMTANKYGEPRFEKPRSLGVFTEMEVEFERNVSRELDNKLEIAKAAVNTAEVSRLEGARDAFVEDLRTLRKEIVDYYATKSIRVYPAEESKYLQAVKVLGEKGVKLPVKQVSHRLVLNHRAASSDIAKLAEELKFDTSGKGMKFVFSADQVLIVNDRTQGSNHEELGRGRDIQAAGYISVPDKTKPLSFKLTNHSGTFCPSVESLEAVKRYLVDRGGSKVDVVAVADSSERCSL